MVETAKKFEETLNKMMNSIVADSGDIRDMDEATFKTIKTSLEFIDVANELVKEQALAIEAMDHKLDLLTIEMKKLLER